MRGQRFGDRAAEAAMNVVIFGGDDRAGFRRRSAPAARASIGLIVGMLTTRAEMPSCASNSAASSARATSTPQATSVTSLPSRMIWPLPISKRVIVAEQALGGAAAGAHIDRAVEFQDRARRQRHLDRIGGRDHGHAGNGAERGEIFERLRRAAVGTDVETGMAGDDLGVAPRIGERQARLFDGAQAEDGEGRDDRDKTDRGQAAGRRHHVLFGDAELQQALGMALAEMMHAGAAGDVGVEHDDVRETRRRVRTSALPKASRRRSPLVPIRWRRLQLAIDIEQLLDLVAVGAKRLQRVFGLLARQLHAAVPGRNVLPCTSRPCP